MDLLCLCCCCVCVGCFTVSFFFSSTLSSMLIWTISHSWAIFKFSVYYGTMIFILLAAFGFTDQIMKTSLDNILTYKRSLEFSDSEKEYNRRRYAQFELLLIIGGNLLLLIVFFFISIYFDTLFLKLPFAFYVTYLLSVVASFPTKGDIDSRRLDSDFYMKVYPNFVSFASLYIFVQYYMFNRQQTE